MAVMEGVQMVTLLFNLSLDNLSHKQVFQRTLLFSSKTQLCYNMAPQELRIPKPQSFFFSQNFQLAKSMIFHAAVGSGNFTFAVCFLPGSLE